MPPGAWKFSEAAHHVTDETAQRRRWWTGRGEQDVRGARGRFIIGQDLHQPARREVTRALTRNRPRGVMPDSRAVASAASTSASTTRQRL